MCACRRRATNAWMEIHTESVANRRAAAWIVFVVFRLTKPKCCAHTKKPIRLNKRRCRIVTGSLYMVFYAICRMVVVCRLSWHTRARARPAIAFQWKPNRVCVCLCVRLPLKLSWCDRVLPQHHIRVPDAMDFYRRAYSIRTIDIICCYLISLLLLCLHSVN